MQHTRAEVLLPEDRISEYGECAQHQPAGSGRSADVSFLGRLVFSFLSRYEMCRMEVATPVEYEFVHPTMSANYGNASKKQTLHGALLGVGRRRLKADERGTSTLAWERAESCGPTAVPD